MASNEAAPARIERPKPTVDRDSRPYWEGLLRHELQLQRCGKCQAHRWPARAICPRCQSWESDWITAAGTGTLVTWTVVDHAIGPAWKARAPYVIGRIRLTDAPEAVLTGDVIDCSRELLAAGLQLEAVFTDESPEHTLLDWRPAGASRSPEGAGAAQA